MNWLGLKHLEFSGLQMKTILKALFLLITLSAVPVFAQSDFDATKARAETGDAQSQYELGNIYFFGEGVAQNDQEALKWYRLASEQGLAAAQYNLGGIYNFGAGVVENDREAVKWYRLAAEQGDASAQAHLGWMYLQGKGVVQNYQKAYMWLSIAVAGGDTSSLERDQVLNLLSPQALEQAQAQATRCFESNFKDCD
jgi:TPR repeat protein